MLLCGLLGAQPVAAQAARERVVDMVEGPGGAAVGDRVRQELAKQSTAQIRSLGAETDDAAPRVIVAVRGAKDGMVNVLYWDFTGRIDALSAPATVGEGHFEIVATALASALLQRNLPRLATERPVKVAESRDWMDVMADLRLQAYRSQPRHRTFPLSVADF